MAEKKKPAKKTPDLLLGRAIAASGVAEIIRTSLENNTVKVLYRVREKRTWLAILEYALSRATDWSAHVCQQYFMRGGKLVYGWNFILQSQGPVEDTVKKVATLLTEGAKVAPKVAGVGLDSFPLVGTSRHRTSNIMFDPRLPGPGRGGPSHKGAYSIQEEK